MELSTAPPGVGLTNVLNRINRVLSPETRQNSRISIINQVPPPRELFTTSRPQVANTGIGFDDTSKYQKFMSIVDQPFFLRHVGGHHGLGDAVIVLRHAVAVARHHSERKFQVLSRIGSLSFLDIPDNLTVISSDNKFNDQNTTPTLWLGTPDRSLDNDQIEQAAERQNFNESDYYVMDLLNHTGVNVDNNLFYSSIFRLTPEQLNDHPVTSDIFIVPDALEMSTDSDFLSRKSLSPEKWRVIFSQLDPKTKVAIAIGTAHSHYCHEVIAAARTVGLQNLQVVQGDLSDFTNAVLSTRKFVGMDSGTTHLAAEMIKAARQAGRTIDFREVFNKGYLPFSTYGITDPEGQFRTLVYKTAEAGDLDNIDPKTVAQFIQS